MGLILMSMAAATLLGVAFIRSEPWQVASTYLDDWEILEVVETECGRMTEKVDGLTVTGTPQEQAAIILKQNEIVAVMLEHIREIDEEILAADEPALGWLADWDELLESRKAYAADVSSGASPEFEVPLDADGDEIITRMDWASEPECYVPETLYDPQPVQQNEV